MPELYAPDISTLLTASSNEFTSFVSKYRIAYAKGELSPAAGFARALMALGYNGLRTLERQIYSDDDDLERRSAKEMDNYLRSTHKKEYPSFALNHAAIVYGAALTGLEEATINGVLDMSTVASTYNLYIQNTGLDKWEPELDESIQLSSQTLQALREGAEEDPSFVFALSPDLLPKPLLMFIRKTTRLPRVTDQQIEGLLRSAQKAVLVVRNDIRRDKPYTANAILLQQVDNSIACDDRPTRIPSAPLSEAEAFAQLQKFLTEQLIHRVDRYLKT